MGMGFPIVHRWRSVRSMATTLVWEQYSRWWSGKPADAEYEDTHASVVAMTDGLYRARLRRDNNYVDFDNEADAKAWCELMFNLKGEKYERKQ